MNKALAAGSDGIKVAKGCTGALAAVDETGTNDGPAGRAGGGSSSILAGLRAGATCTGCWKPLRGRPRGLGGMAKAVVWKGRRFKKRPFSWPSLTCPA